MALSLIECRPQTRLWYDPSSKWSQQISWSTQQWLLKVTLGQKAFGQKLESKTEQTWGVRANVIWSKTAAAKLVLQQDEMQS